MRGEVAAAVVEDTDLPSGAGIDSPYERSEAPELHIDTTRTSPEGAGDRILEELRRRGILSVG